MSGFTGFSAEGLQLLASLDGFDKEQFTANKKAYTRLVATPAKAFVSALLPRLQAAIGPDITGAPKTNGSIAPINNDLRFSPDKSPYKDHLLFRFWEGSEKKLAPTLWVRLSATQLGFATGVGFDPAGLARFRARVGGPDGESWVAAVDALTKDHSAELAGPALKRVPKPWPADHPRAEWLTLNKGLQLRWPEPLPADLDGPGLVDLCTARLTECSAVHRWLVQTVG
ncbi:MAG: hypothetical protein ACI8PZ_006919 [Myxococcota bacterium]|jgi:uncharacterized protein (TIGR02453 family)